MNVEHRLARAGRELREVDIEVPPLGRHAPSSTKPVSSARRPVAALALPTLFAIAGLFVVVGVRHTRVDQVPRGDLVRIDDPLGHESAVVTILAGDGDDTSTVTASQPSYQEELATIARITSARTARPAAAPPIRSQPAPASPAYGAWQPL